LSSLILKAFGPTALLAALLKRVPQVDAAYIYGSWARRYSGEAGPAPRDLDVLVVGNPNVNAVYAAGRRAETELGLEVNPLVVTPGEWEAPTGVLKRIKSGPIVEVPWVDAKSETIDCMHTPQWCCMQRRRWPQTLIPKLSRTSTA
jgi:predicted nucleotidyltransferase